MELHSKFIFLTSILFFNLGLGLSFHYDRRALSMINGSSSIIPQSDPFQPAIDVGYDGRALTINGKRRVILSGSIHYPRSTPQMWTSLIRKAKEGGLDAIETYVFWNAHEPQYRQYDFTGNLDLVAFLKTIQNEGLYAILRIGPYVCAEWNYGGFPVWLHNLPDIKFRTNNWVFEQEMKVFTVKIVDMVKHEKLFASQGGPIILAQIENEYGNVMGSYGEDGKKYIQWCADMAQSMKTGVPWIMCQQDNAPDPMLNTCNGWYCDGFKPKNNQIPKMWTENWTGWFTKWGDKEPHRTAEDVAFAVARFFQFGGTMQNYYMYHGGTNFGRTAGGPYITTSYDYDAPLDEYGNLNQPKWGHLKALHYHLHEMEQVLTHGDVQTTDYGNLMSVTNYTYNGRSSCFLGNANNGKDFYVTLLGNNFTVPAWSVSILPDCKTEIYNTAKVNAQTSIMVKKETEAEEEPYSLEWQWRAEELDHWNAKLNMKKTTFMVNKLMEQKAVTNDTSDFLYYMTKFPVYTKDPFTRPNTTLSVQTTGHVLHVYLNEKHIGTQSGYQFTYENNVQLPRGMNTLTLISATVGLANYGGNFDTVDTGILGPVKLTSKLNNDLIVKDLSTNKWLYKVGLNGEEEQLYNGGGISKWHTDNLPIKREFIWYKTTFKAPLGEDPVVVDLLGMGKGTAWVNGQSLGRYWPSNLASMGGCDATCDYRGAYTDKKCLYNCGNPTQRWYHVPRSFLRDGENTLVLLEEFGGNPSNINFKTITVGKICAHSYEGHRLELQCQGDRKISRIRFASFGNPAGNCGSFDIGECHSSMSKHIVQKLCLGKNRCIIHVTQKTFGTLHCLSGEARTKGVAAGCGCFGLLHHKGCALRESKLQSPKHISKFLNLPQNSMEEPRKHQVSLRGASAKEITRDALLEKVSHERELRHFTRRATAAALFIQRVWRRCYATKKAAWQLREEWELLLTHGSDSISKSQISLCVLRPFLFFTEHLSLKQQKFQARSISCTRNCFMSLLESITSVDPNKNFSSLATGTNEERRVWVYQTRKLITLCSFILEVYGSSSESKDMIGVTSLALRLVIILSDLKGWRCISDQNRQCAHRAVQDLIRFIGSRESGVYKAIGKYISTLVPPSERQSWTDDDFLITASVITLALRPFHVVNEDLEDVTPVMQSSVELYCMFILPIPWLVQRIPALLLPALRHTTVLIPCFMTLQVRNIIYFVCRNFWGMFIQSCSSVHPVPRCHT
ncbi:Beta-galactosidase 7 [Dionaea muscipula]